MSSIARVRRVALCVAACLALVAAALPGIATARALQTAVSNSGPFSGSAEQSQRAFARARLTGATWIRINASWKGIAPSARPVSWDPENPGDPAYSWGQLDDQVRRAVAAGLKPYVGVTEAPTWAERSSGGGGGTNSPDPDELGRFMRAAARRFDGSTAGLPTVRYWEVWNEPNASYFFNPQRENGRDVSPGLYRAMVNASAKAVRGVSSSNRVIAGAAFPFSIDRTDAQAIGAYRFLKEVMAKRVAFDVWSTHPYTQGNAFHKAFNQDSASLGDLSRVRKLLVDGYKRGKISAKRSPSFWVTEFQWDSAPPDPKGVPMTLLRRWTSEALYQGWRSGVSLFTWFQLRDDPAGEPFQGGLFARCGGEDCYAAKPIFVAFRFPFVAYLRDGRVTVWGRTPASDKRKVVIEQRDGSDWRRLGSVRAAGGGIFSARLRPKGKGELRARTSQETSASFSLKVPRDRPETIPFGS